MEILLTKNEKLTSDDLNWIFSVKCKNKWENWWYYPNLETCYFDLLEYYAKKSTKNTITEMFDDSIKKLEILRKEILHKK